MLKINRRTMFRKTPMYTGILLAAVSSASAIAQDQTDQTKSVRLEEVIVTATRQEESLQDVAMSIDVATGDELEGLKLFNFKDIAVLSPGLDITSNGRNTFPVMRGISFNPDSGGQSVIATYFNEVPLDINRLDTSTFDLQQVEVLRGPQGATRGITAPAGAILLSTRRANLNEVEGRLLGSATDEGGRNLQGGVSVPLVEGKLGMRVAGLVDRNRANHVRNITSGQRSKEEAEGVRATLSFAPTDTFNGSVVYQYSKNDLSRSVQVFGTGNQPSLLSPHVSGPVIRPEERFGVQGTQSRFENTTEFWMADLHLALQDHNLSAVLGYIDSKLKTRSPVDTGNAIENYDQLLITDAPTTYYSIELRLDSMRDGPFNYSVGTFFGRDRTLNSRSTIEVNQYFGLGVPYTPVPPALAELPILATVDVDNDKRILAVFGNAKYAFSDRLRGELGVRYTVDEASAQSFLTVTSPGGQVFGTPVPGFTNPDRLPTVAPQFVDQSSHPLTGSASLSYDWTADSTSYLAWGRSFRRGVAQLGVTANVDSSLLVIEPEKSDSIELGFKSLMFDGRLRFNIAAYYQKFDGFIGLDTVRISSSRDGIVNSGPLTVAYNADATARGVETQMFALLTDNWDASLSMAYGKAEYDNALIPCNDFNFDGKADAEGTPAVPVGQQVSFCRSNDKLSDLPAFSLVSTSEYRLPLGSYEGFVSGLYNFRPSFTEESSGASISESHRINLFAGIRGGKDNSEWELTLFVKNLLDREKVTSVGEEGELQQTTVYADAPPGSPATSPAFRSGYRSVTVEAPREFGVALSYRF